MTNHSEHAQHLLKSAKRCSDADIGPLLQLYINYLRILATTQLERHLRQRVSPSDVVQETLLEAHRDFPQFRGDTAYEFVGWLRKILVNNVARVVERNVQAAKRDVRREVPLSNFQRNLEQSNARLENILIDGSASPLSKVQHHEHTLLLADALAEMPADYRDVIVLRNLEGLDFNAVAERMDRKSGAVRMLWLRAMERLRKQLNAIDMG